MPLFLLLVALGAQPDLATPAIPSSGGYVAGAVVGRLWEQDLGGGADLDGYRLGFVAISREANTRYGHVGSYYVEWKRGGRQEIVEGGLELTFPYLHLPRGGAGPRVKVALQKRNEPPYRGLDGVVGVGVEAGAWLTERLQLAAVVDRTVGFEARGRTSFALHLRVMFWAE